MENYFETLRNFNLERKTYYSLSNIFQIELVEEVHLISCHRNKVASFSQQIFLFAKKISSNSKNRSRILSSTTKKSNFCHFIQSQFSLLGKTVCIFTKFKKKLAFWLCFYMVIFFLKVGLAWQNISSKIIDARRF